MRRIHGTSEENEEENGGSFSNVRALLATRKLEGVNVMYMFKNAKLAGIIEGDEYKCGCSFCNYDKVLNANEFEKHAGVTSSHPNNHIYLENGKTLHEVVKHLARVPPELRDNELEAVTGIMNGSPQTRSCEARQSSNNQVKQIGLDGKTGQEILFTRRLPQNSSFLQKATNEGLTRGTPPRIESNMFYLEAENSSLRKKRGFDIFNSSQHVVTEAEQTKEVILKDGYLYPKTFKCQKREIDFLMRDHLDVRGLLASNYLYGQRVKYKKDKVELDGLITDAGYLCGCPLCKYKEVVSALKFETHARATSSNQNNYIYLESGISLYALVKQLNNAPPDSRPALIEQYSGIQINKSQFSGWGGSLQISGDLEEVSQNGEENGKKRTVELHSDPHLVTGSVSSPTHAVKCIVNPASTVNYVSFRSSATEGIKHGLDILIHSTSIFSKSSMLENKTETKRLSDSTTEGSKAEPSSINIMCNSPQPCIEGNIIPSAFIDFFEGTSSCIDVNNHSELAKERLRDSITEGSKGAPSSVNVMCNSPEPHIEESIITSSCIDIKISSELDKEGRLHDSTTEGNKAAPSSINVMCNFPQPNIGGNIIPSCMDVSISSELPKEVRLPDSITEGSKATPPSINVPPSSNVPCDSPQPHTEGDINRSCIDVNISLELAKEGRPPDSTTEHSKATPSSINVPCNFPQQLMEGNIIPSSRIDANISFLELAKEGHINPGSDKMIYGSSITQKSSTTETRPERRKRLPGSSNFLESDVRDVQRSSAAKGGPKKRTGDLHQIIFKGNALQDGAELFYISDRKIILKGKKRENGIQCQCCNDVVSPSKFEKHAGFEQRKQPYRSIFTASGISLHDLAKSLSNCQKLASICTICGSGGELLSCSGCAKAAHADCLDLPGTPDTDSEFHCLSCKHIFESGTTSEVRSPVATKPINFGRKRVIKHPKDVCCTLCEDDAFEMGKEFGSKSFIFCGQCEKLYHVGCLKDHDICDLQERPLPWFSWLCSVKCKEVHQGLEHFVLNSPYNIHGSVLSRLKKRAEERGLTSADEAELKWQLLSGTHKTHNEMLFSKATATFQEAFGPIIEKGYDLIPAMVEGRELAKQHYGGMYCAVITKNSEVVSAGLLRVFGQDVAELPLVATAKECRGKGYFQALLSIVEQLLIRLKVKFLILPADENTQSIWINKIGFSRMTEERVKQYAEDHWILMFKKTAMLEKALPQFQS